MHVPKDMDLQLSTGVRGLFFRLSLHLPPYIVYAASSEGSGDTAQMHRLV